MKIFHRTYWICLAGFNLLLVSTAWTQATIIKGIEPQYAGEQITFYTLSDRIVNSQHKLGVCTVDPSGNFLFDFSHNNTIQVFADLGIYRTYLYTEPGKIYTVKLPPRIDKTEAEKLNPYFKPREVHLGILNYNDDDLNIRIRAFDDQFNPIFGKYTVKAYLQTDFKDLDSVLSHLNKQFNDTVSLYFQCYKRYKFELLRDISLKQKSPELSLPEYFPIAILYHNPAFSDWFSQVYRNYLEYLSKTGNIENIHSIVNEEKDLHLLLNTIYRAGAVENDTIVEYIVLKGLYDGYFSSEFKESAILEMLDTLRNTTGIKEHRLTAENILTKVTRLKTGNKPPGFTLPAFDSTLVSLDDLKGKFVYLNFCTSLSFPCLSQFNLIKPIYEKYREVLHVVTVSVDEDNSRFMNLIRTNGYTWIFLDARDQPDIINLYDIHAFPTYFLIGPDGRLVLSPAPEPGADFERSFSDVLRSRNVLNPHP